MGTESRVETPRVSGLSASTRLEPPTEPRETTPAAPEVVDQLFAEPYSFGFFQAVHLLERHFAERAPVGGFSDPASEAVRFRTNPKVSFPASELDWLGAPAGDTSSGSKSAPPELTVNFLGLTGPQGALPLPYLLYVAERERFGDGAIRAFFDIFSHRAISLFYRAWESRHAAAVYARGERDWATRHLLDLLGLRVEGLTADLPFSAETLVFYAGLLSMTTRPASALEEMLADYFGVPVEVEQFVGGWYRLDGSAQMEVGGLGDSASLGAAAVGDEVWDQQGRIRIRVGPLARAQYERFLPGGDAHEPLRALVRFFTGDEIDFELQLVLARDEVPQVVLGGDDAGSVSLGWSTWLKTKPLGRDADETILTP
jgi:type VI secretion system protein ImpH